MDNTPEYLILLWEFHTHSLSISAWYPFFICFLLEIYGDTLDDTKSWHMKHFSKIEILQFILTQNLQFIFLPKNDQKNQK